MKTIGFIGLGLIGGSIARAIRKYHEDYRILAYDRDRETLATAVSSNMIDAVCEEQDERFKKCRSDGHWKIRNRSSQNLPWDDRR